MKYELTIKGMKCSNCANKIETKLKNFDGVQQANVNLITEKALISIKSPDTVDTVKALLENMNYKILSVNDLNKVSGTTREMILKFLLPNSKNWKEDFAKVDGVVTVETLGEPVPKSNDQLETVAKVEYDTVMTKGHLLMEELEAIYKRLAGLDIEAPNTDLNLKFINQFSNTLNSLTEGGSSTSGKELAFCVVLTSLLIYLTMFDDIICKFLISHPLIISKLNSFLIVVVVLSGLVIYKFGLPLYKRTYTFYFSHRIVNMETLITLGSVAACLLSFLHIGRFFFSAEKEEIYHVKMAAHSLEAAATVLAISVVGKYIEERAKKNIKTYTTGTFKNFSFENGCTVNWIKPKNKKFAVLQEKQIDVGLVEKEDIVRYRVGNFVQIDCIILKGEFEVKENISFGYDVLTTKGPGDKLKSGCKIERIVNGQECFVLVDEVLEESLIFKIVKEMSASLGQKLKFQHFIDKIVNYFVPFVITVAILTFLGWFIIYLLQDEGKITFSFVVEKAISILVVSCPCAFGLAIPTVTTIAMNKGLKEGILIKNLSVLPEIRNSNAFVFDKTGTLTHVLSKVNVEYNRNVERGDFNGADFPIFKIVSLLEKSQKHPIAEVLFAFCMKNSNSESKKVYLTPDSKVEVSSNGICGSINLNDQTMKVLIGSRIFMERNNANFTSEIDEIHTKCKQKLLNVTYIAVDKVVELVLSIDSTSELREEAVSVADSLRKVKPNGKIFILSGDEQESVNEVGRKLQIRPENSIGQAENQTKKQFLNQLKSKNQKVLMIGDGVNDILSLSEANYGISFNANSDLNMVASDIIFVKEDLRLILSLLKLSKLTFIFICINIFWAFIYNLVMLPVTSGVLHFFWDIQMTPTSSSFSMFLSSLLIIITSNFLRCFSLKQSGDQTVKMGVSSVSRGRQMSYNKLVESEFSNNNTEQLESNRVITLPKK